MPKDAAIDNAATDNYRMLWHISFISLYSSFERLKKILGQDLTELSEDDQAYISEWANSSGGLRCVFHATAIKRIAERQLFMQKAAFFIPRTLLQAIVVLLAFTRYGSLDNKTMSTDMSGRDFPELKLAGFDFRIALFDLEISISTGRTMNALYNTALHTLVDIMGRQGFWNISEIFASGVYDLLAQLAPGSIYIDCFTLNPSTNRQQNVDAETTVSRSDLQIVEISDHRTALSNQVPLAESAGKCSRCSRLSIPCHLSPGES